MVFGEQFLKAENQFLEMQMTYVPLISNVLSAIS
jgi:hypothetical protein